MQGKLKSRRKNILNQCKLRGKFKAFFYIECMFCWGIFSSKILYTLQTFEIYLSEVTAFFFSISSAINLIYLFIKPIKGCVVLGFRYFSAVAG